MFKKRYGVFRLTGTEGTDSSSEGFECDRRIATIQTPQQALAEINADFASICESCTEYCGYPLSTKGERDFAKTQIYYVSEILCLA